MSPDKTIRVKISSEDAGSIALTRVFSREVRITELLEWIVAVTGKDTPRVAQILSRGSFVKGLSRIRWEPIDAHTSIDTLLSALPEDWPERPFLAQGVDEVVIECGPRRIAVQGTLVRGRRWFSSQSFIDRWLASPELPNPDYDRYDYDERADHFRAAVPSDALPAFQAAVERLPHRGLRRALLQLVPSGLRFILPRK